MDILPIQLSLTVGDLITLWAPAWRENGEEWEGFLGNEDGVHVFPDAAMLTAYVRTVEEHDLSDHPSWSLVPRLSAPELVPSEDQCYDLIGVPEIAADEPDTWMVGELASITEVVRSLADACELHTVHDVLDSAEGFAVLDRGTWAFTGRDGKKLWEQLAETIANRWDEVIDALDGVMVEPDVDPAAVEAARREFSEPTESPTGGDQAAGQDDAAQTAAEDTTPTNGSFWEEVGIDPIVISTDEGEFHTLRCYLNDRPLFLGAEGRVQTFGSSEALVDHLAHRADESGNDLAQTSTWPEITQRAADGELTVQVDPQNIYHLAGLGEDLAAGPEAVDPNQLDLGVELLLDVGEWAGDDAATVALAPSQSLGWLTSCVLRPDPTRLAPSPPFDTEAGRWNDLVENLVSRLRPRHDHSGGEQPSVPR